MVNEVEIKNIIKNHFDEMIGHIVSSFVFGRPGELVAPRDAMRTMSATSAYA